MYTNDHSVMAHEKVKNKIRILLPLHRKFRKDCKLRHRRGMVGNQLTVPHYHARNFPDQQIPTNR